MSDSYEIKSAQLNMVALQLKSTDWVKIGAELIANYGKDSEGADFFSHDPLILDFDQLPLDASFSSYDSLLVALRQCNLLPVAVRSKKTEWLEFGFLQGMAEATSYTHKRKDPVVKKDEPPAHSIPSSAPAIPTMILDKPVRSGQKFYAKGSDLIVLKVVNAGAEIIADGNIHVYAPLRGRAGAGARGDETARIFAQQFSPELISIAGVYKTREKLENDALFGQAVQVSLNKDGAEEKLRLEALGS